MGERLRSSVFCLACLVGFSTSADAQQALTLERALSLARAHNRDLQAARARIASAEAGVEQVRSALWPTVQVQGKYTHNVPEVAFEMPGFDTMGNQVAGSTAVITPADQLDAALTGTVPLVVPSAYPAIAAAEKRKLAEAYEVRVTETQLLYTTARAFFTAASAEESLATRAHAIGVAERTLEVAQARLEAGTATQVEVTRARVALLRARQAEREAQAAREDAYAQLATLIRTDGALRVMPAEDDEQAPLATDTLAAQARAQRPELAAQQQRIEALSAEADALAYRWAPTLSAFGSARAFNYAGFSGQHTALAFGLQLDWLAYDGGARDAERHALEAQVRELLLQRDQLHHAIDDEVRQAARAVEVSRTAVETTELALALSQETLELVRAQYEAGAVPQIELLTAQDGLVAAQVARARARFDLALSRLSLARSAGTFPGLRRDQ